MTVGQERLAHSLPAPKTPARIRRPLAMPPLVAAAALFLAAMLFVAVFADLLAPFAHTDQSLLNRLKPSSLAGGPSGYLLGTDHLGRDILSRLVNAIRMSLLVALVSTVLGAAVGTTLGFLAAHARGWLDDAIMAAVDFQASMPYVVVALAMLAFFGNSFLLFVLLMGLLGWERYARLARGLVMVAERQGYVLAVRSLGAGHARLYFRHILPNVLSALIVQVTLNFPEIILLETSLSFLGLGIQPPRTSLGLMLGEGRNYLMTAWWIAVLPGSVIFLTTLSMSIVGDWLRDRLDPSLR